MTGIVRPGGAGEAIPAWRRAFGHVLLAGGIVVIFAAPAFFLTTGYRLAIARLALHMAVLAATWSLLAGVAGQFSFAHVALAGIAAYASSIWIRDITSPWGSLPAGMAIGVVTSWVVGTLLGLLLLRLRAAYLALFTIAFAEIVRLVVVAEADFTGGRLSLGVRRLPGSSRAHYYLMVATLAAVLAAIYLLLRSRTGLNLRAMREDEEATAAMGVDVVRLKVLVFSFTSLLVGVGAVVYAHTSTRLVPDQLALLVMGQVIAVAVIGGVESPLAAAIGALIVIELLENLRRIQLEPGTLNVVAALAALAAVVVVVRAVRAWQRAGRRAPAAALPLGMLAASAATSIAFLHQVDGSDWAWGWALVAAACLAAFRHLIRQRPRDWLERSAPGLTAGAVLTVVAVRAATAEQVDWDPGIWRFAVFGAVLMLTLRFARNGLLHPLLEWLTGRRRTVGLAFRERADRAQVDPTPDLVAAEEQI